MCFTCRSQTHPPVETHLKWTGRIQPSIQPMSLPVFCLPSGVLPHPSSIFSFPPAHTDCVEALRVCSADPRCEALYRGLELCAADAAVSPLGEQVAAECLERQDALLGRHPALSSCKCQRGLRKEEQCLHIYWSVRLMPGQSPLSCLCPPEVPNSLLSQIYILNP